MLEAIRYQRGSLDILDQLLLPSKSFYESITSVKDGYDAIKLMKVRGAPAISIVAALSVAVELSKTDFSSKENLHKIINETEKLLASDVRINKAIGDAGGKYIVRHVYDKPVSILTHCNTGSLATAGYGTALGVIRWLYENDYLEHVYCTETRPYNQGARLTAYELVHDGIPSTLICDSMAAALMNSGNVSAVIVGADRVVTNGDTANKIGTYQLAVCAKHHNVPFFVACPRSTLDFNLVSGDFIPIEERPQHEMLSINSIPIAAPGIKCWNPAFDVTPGKLITGIVTEVGVFKPEELKANTDKLSSMDLLKV